MQDAHQGRSGNAILTATQAESRQCILRRWISRLCTATIIVGSLNFLLFTAGTFFIGGDAVNGKAENGRFYVWGYHNGAKQYTEVSQSVFSYSRWHCYTVFVTWPMVIVSGLVLNRLSRND